MKDNTELEEGEACYNKDDDEASIDLDSLSYIDEKIQHVLGHFQKDFEGGVSAENLGAKFGGYGSFLPTYERSPRLCSHSKTPQRNHSPPKSPINLHMEAASHNTKAPSNMSHSARLGTASHSSHSFDNLRVPPVDDSVKKDRGMSSSEVAEKSTFKDDIAKKSGNSTDQRTLKFRIIMKSNILAQKNAEIYSGLGLDNSPSSSMGNSPLDNEAKPPVSQENAEDSPSGIIQVMTSFPIPGGVLTSPLHECLLYLPKKEKVIEESRYTSSLNGHQQPCSMSTDESDSFIGDEHLKKRKVRIVRKSEKRLELKHMNGALSENDTTVHTKKNLGNRTPDHKDFLLNDLKCTPLSSSICDAAETAEVTGKASEVSKEVNKDGMPGRKVSVEVVKEESLESISGQDFGKTEKQNPGNGYMKHVFEHKLDNCIKDDFTDPKNNDKCNTYMISKKVECGAVKGKVDQDPQKVKAVPDGNNKSKGDQSPGKSVAIARKDSFGNTNNATVTDKKSASFGVSSCKSKMNKRKPLKDNKIRDSSRYSSKGKKSELKVDVPAGNNSIKNVNTDNFEKHSAFGAKVKERPSGNKVVHQLLDEPTLKDASGSFPIAENKPASGMIPSTVPAPQLIAEDWVCCDNCQQWRLLPTGMKPEQLPEKWLCSMLDWLPGMNRCDISEDETTKALHALLYQMPISEGQNNMQIHATGTTIGGSSNDALHFCLNHKKSSSDVLHGRGKKKRVIKERTMEGIKNDMLQSSDSVKINALECGQKRRLTGKNQHPTDSNLTKKTSSKHFSRLNNLIEDNKHVPKEKEKEINKGDTKYIKLKRKKEADQYRTGIPKKSKTEDVCYADKQLNSGVGLEKVGLNSRNGLPTKTSGKDMRKYDVYCLSEDVEDKLLVPTKKGDRAVVFSDGGSLDVKNNSQHDGSLKKRKSKDRMDNEKHCKSFSLQNDKQCGGEGNASGFRNKRNYGILNTSGDDKLNEGRMRQADTQVDEALQPNKHRKSITSHQVLVGIKPLGMDLGSEQLSLAAASSSSKISGSHKVKTNHEDVIGSPVESVTSSPLRTTNMNKRVLLVGDISRKDDATKGGPSTIGSRTSVDHRKGRLSVKMKEDRISHNSNHSSHKFSSAECQVEDAKDKARVQSKTSSEVVNDHLLEIGVPVQQHDNFANGMRPEEKVNKKKLEGGRPLQKSGKVTSLHSKQKDKRSDSQVDKDNIKVSASENDYSNSGGRYDSAFDTSYHASGPETRNDAKYSSSKSKCEMDNNTQKNAQRHGSSETGKHEPKQKYLESSILKIDAQCSTDSKTISQQNLTQDFEENNANHACTGSRDGKFKIISTDLGEVQRETSYGGPRTAPGYQKGDMSHEHPVPVSGNGDVAKLMRKSVDLSVSSPVRINSSQTAAFNTLEEATKLKDMADHFKNSGFEFESNESYFNSALKFLHGASLLENCHGESSKHGEMNPMQVYATAAKLFKSCAHGYERREEMAAAALAYKCMEVAYMRVVNCTNSVTSRDRHELLSALQMVSQGESPSSSASDVDNLYNQTGFDKATLPKATNSHVAGNQVLTARTQTNLVRLLDFIQDINFAMEASRKCQSTFAAANVNMEEARNRDCIGSIRRVVDFSFQDVDELVRLVWIANKAISGADLGGARD